MTYKTYEPPILRVHGPVESQTQSGFIPMLSDPVVTAPATNPAFWQFLPLLLLFGLFKGNKGVSGGDKGGMFS